MGVDWVWMGPTNGGQSGQVCTRGVYHVGAPEDAADRLPELGEAHGAGAVLVRQDVLPRSEDIVAVGEETEKVKRCGAREGRNEVDQVDQGEVERKEGLEGGSGLLRQGRV